MHKRIISDVTELNKGVRNKGVRNQYLLLVPDPFS